MNRVPWAKLTTRMMPKMTVNPTDSKNSKLLKANAFEIWTTANGSKFSTLNRLL
jgi:hypothetical protein